MRTFTLTLRWNDAVALKKLLSDDLKRMQDSLQTPGLRHSECFNKKAQLLERVVKELESDKE
jgi:hypothetical protein